MFVVTVLENYVFTPNDFVFVCLIRFHSRFTDRGKAHVKGKLKHRAFVNVNESVTNVLDANYPDELPVLTFRLSIKNSFNKRLCLRK